MKFRILIIFVLFACGAFSSPLEKQECWIVIDGSKVPFDDAWLKATQEVDRIGFLINLKFDNQKEVFYHSGANQIDLSVLIQAQQSSLEHDGLQRALLFNIDEQDVSRFNGLLESDERLSHSSRSLNVELSALLKQKHILLFSLENHEQLSDKVLFFNDYFEQHHINKNYQQQILNPGKTTASMLFGIYDNVAPTSPTPITKEERHTWQTKYLTHWQRTGMQPILLVANEHLFNFNQIIRLSQTTKFTNSCSGRVTINGVPVKQTYWNTSPPSLSYGYFNFPFSDKATIQPYKPGYEFAPKKIEITEGDSTNNLKFTARPVDLSEDLELKFDFNPDSKFPEDFITTDHARGKILRLPAHKNYFLGFPEELNFVDNSFTIAFWFKHLKESPKSHILLGTNKESFREGFHISINNLRPYFGFFIDDIDTESMVEEGKWHHLTFSFDNVTKEKRIYIDGQLDALQLESHSFIGKDSLFLGQSLSLTSGSPSHFDNLLIWSRSLSAIEVEQLMHEETFLKLNQSHYSGQNTLIISGFIAILLILINFIFLGKKKRNTIKLKHKAPVKNAFFLYGNFALFDSIGNNIGNELTPLSKELLLMLLIAKLEGRKGETSKALTRMFWEDLTTPKARNSRNVAIARLRKSLEKMQCLSVEYIEGHHCIQINDEIYVDFQQSEQLSGNSELKNIECYFRTVKRGTFCEDLNYQWLEPIQDKYNNQVISNLSNFIEDEKLKLSISTKQQFCEHILKLDDLDEKALKELMRIYTQLGNRNKAINLFNEFKSKYLSSYGEEFQASANEILM